MKKFNLTKTAILITALVIFSSQNSFANARTYELKKEMTKPVKDTPYIARVTIVKTGEVDTPYLNLSLPAENIYKQIQTLLLKQEGLFKINIIFETETGEFIREEEYYLEKR